MIDTLSLKKGAAELGIELDDRSLDRFDLYAQLLIEWNEKINLTAITEPSEIVTKHFVDSLSFLKYNSIEKDASIIDVGTGAGFPGLVILIARPGLNITLMDSTKKKLLVIEDILNKLDLSANIVHMRAEEAGKSPEFRESFDFSTARAVTNMRDLCEYCLPFVKKGGYFSALKGAGAREELELAQNAIKILGGQIDEINEFSLKDCGDRAIIKVKKISQTPAKYPRPHAQIAKKPLI